MFPIISLYQSDTGNRERSKRIINMKKRIINIIFAVATIFAISGCSSEMNYKYHTFVYAYNEDEPLKQCCVVVCGQPEDDVIWVELPQNYYEAASNLAADSCYYWYIATDDKLYRSNSEHNFYPTGATEEGFTLFTNNTGFTIGINDEHDYVYFTNQQARTPLHIPLQKKVIQY